MRKNFVKEKMRAGEPSFGVGFLWPSPETVEFCGHLGFEWLWLDLEHGGFDLQTLSQVVRAAEVSGLVPIGRLPQTDDPELVLRYMERGLMGIITSHTRSKEDIEFAVSAVKYPPVGMRSAGSLRSADWGLTQPFAEYCDASNRETMVMALVEDQEGIDNLDEILSVDGLDAVVIGFGDLSLTMGYPGQKSHPEVLAVGRAAQEKVLASDKALQVTVQDGEEARQWVKDGALLLRCSVQKILAKACTTWLQEARG
jgi:4-hydroxy-2-oxoheptanedioate aldolase